MRDGDVKCLFKNLLLLKIALSRLSAWLVRGARKKAPSFRGKMYETPELFNKHPNSSLRPVYSAAGKHTPSGKHFEIARVPI